MEQQFNEVVGQPLDSKVVIDPEEIARKFRQGALENEATASTIVYGDPAEPEAQQ